MISGEAKGERHYFVLEHIHFGEFACSQLLPRNVWKATKKWIQGFSPNHLKVGGQVFLSFVVFLAMTSPLPVWEAFSYGTIVPPVACIFMILLGVQGGSMGNTTLLEIYMLASIVVSGLIATLIKYLTWLAAGQDWSNNNVSKGATYVVLVSVSCGVFNILRWKWDATNMFFCFASIFLIFGLGAYSGVDSEVDYLNPVWVLVNIGTGTLITTLCSWFFFPILASESFRNATAESIHRLSKAVGSCKELILSPIDSESGLLQEASGKIDVITWRDEGLWDRAQKIAIDQRGARSSILSTRNLRIPVFLEFDFYTPGRFRFPMVPFLHLQTHAQLMSAVVGNMIRPIKSGNLNMRLMQEENIRIAVHNLCMSLESALDAIALSIRNTSKHPWSNADSLLETCHSCWIVFLRMGQNQLRKCSDSDESFALRTISIFLFTIASNLREIYFSASIAIYKEDMDSLKLALGRLRRRPFWITSRTAYTNLDKDPDELTSLVSSKELDADADSSIKGNEVYIHEAQKSGAIKRVLNSAFGLPSSAVLRPKKAFKVPIWLIVGLQYAISVAIALTLSVIPPVANNVFHGRSNDVIFTVVVMWQPNIGSTTKRTFNRVIGTVMGAIWSYFLLAVTYGVTGTSWSDSPQKWIVSGFLASIWAFFCTINGSRYPSYAYMWFVAGFTVPLVCQTLLRAPSPPWTDAAERLLNVIIGISINWLVSMFIFPISAYRMAKENYASNCSAMGTLLYSLPDLFEPVSTTDSSQGVSDEPYVSTMRALENTFGAKAVFHPFQNQEFATSISQSNRCRCLLADVSAFIGPAEDENLLFRTPHRIPKGRIALAIDASNFLLDFVVQILAIKLDFFPSEAWKLPSRLYYALLRAISAFAVSLDQLDIVVHKGGQNIESAIQSLSDAEKAAADFVKISYQMLYDFHHLPPEADNPCLKNAELLLVYVTISMFQQIKSVFYAASKAFMLSHPTAESLAEDSVYAEDCLSQLDHGAETLIGMMMELSTSHSSNIELNLRRSSTLALSDEGLNNSQLRGYRQDTAYDAQTLHKALEWLRRLRHRPKSKQVSYRRSFSA